MVSRSRSLWDVHLDVHGLKSAFGDPDLFVGKGPNKEPLLIMTRTVLLPGSDRVFTPVMAKDSSALTQTLKKTRISLFLGLGFAATGLVLGFMFQIVYGLRPLHLLRRELSRVHQGHQEGFRLRYPLEIQPLVEDINRLLHHYGELLQRARSHTGNPPTPSRRRSASCAIRWPSCRRKIRPLSASSSIRSSATSITTSARRG